MRFARSTTWIRWWGSAWLVLALVGCGPAAESPAPAGEAVAEVPAEPVVTPAMLEQGRNTYIANCGPCHGTSGRGDGPSSFNLDPKPRDHTNREYMDTLTDEKIRQTVLYGGVISGMPQMPSHPHIKDGEMTALIAFVRSLSRNGAEPAGDPVAAASL